MAVALAGTIAAPAATPAAQARLSPADFRGISGMSPAQLNHKARGFEAAGIADSALIYYNVLSDRHNTALGKEDRRLCVDAMLSAAGIYYEMFDYGKAMELLLRCTKACDTDWLRGELADAYRIIGNIYSTHADYERGSAFYHKSLALADSIGDNSLRMKALNNLIGACSLEGDLKSARRHYARLATIKTADPLYEYDLIIDGALIAAADGDEKSAAAAYRDAAAYAARHTLGIKYSGAAYSCLGALFRQSGQIDSALHYLHLNEAAARESHQTDLLSETLDGLWQLYAEKGERELSQQYRDEYLEVSSEIFNQREFNNLKNAEFMYELERNAETIDTLNRQKTESAARLAAQRRVLWAVSVASLIVLGLLVVIYFQKKVLSKAYADLFEKNRASLEAEQAYRHRLRELERDRGSVVSDAMPDRVREQLSRRIRDIMERIDVICDPDFSASRLAEMVESNSTYVSLVVNEMYGKNFRTVLNECRIKESMKRLADRETYGNYTIKAIAESVGYKSQSNFITVFRKYAGITPSMYYEMAMKHKSQPESRF